MCGGQSTARGSQSWASKWGYEAFIATHLDGPEWSLCCIIVINMHDIQPIYNIGALIRTNYTTWYNEFVIGHHSISKLWPLVICIYYKL